MTGSSDAIVKLVPSIHDVDAAAWDACANPDGASFNPFVAHAFLNALEQAKTVGPGTGWLPRHVILDDGRGGIAAAAPCYVKNHSQGEYVFDYGWAEAYELAGGRYYPKLQLSVPFTPVPGPRLLVKGGAQAAANEQVLAAAAVEVARQNGLSSVHLTFLAKAVAERLKAMGFLLRTGQQFHWSNSGYRDFGDFLQTFASRKRKGVRKERGEALSAGLEIERVQGADIKEMHWDALYKFYIDTGNRKWGRPYLNRQFFSLLGESLASRCLLIFAKRGSTYVAGTLHMIGGDCLYGRYWGAIEHHPSLHFELCYYQAIDYAIAHALPRVEAGAQGEHKLARGYLPVETYSAHWIADPGLRKAVERFVKQERAYVTESNAELAEAGPYRSNAMPEPIDHSMCEPDDG